MKRNPGRVMEGTRSQVRKPGPGEKKEKRRGEKGALKTPSWTIAWEGWDRNSKGGEKTRFMRFAWRTN